MEGWSTHTPEKVRAALASKGEPVPVPTTPTVNVGPVVDGRYERTLALGDHAVGRREEGLPSLVKITSV